MTTIVLGLDGSPGSQDAARWAARVASETGARVVAVHAVPRSELWMLGALQVDITPVVDELRRQLNETWTAPLRDAHVECEAHIVRGDPAAELLRVANERDATMLVLGTTSHGAVHDLVVGSTVHKVINRSPVPVVLVPSSRRARAA
jgi:nucleotide-binding universal stress UspA family protein